MEWDVELGKESRVLVTGAAGHIGGTLVRLLLERGVRPRVLVHNDTRALDGLEVERLEGDVLDFASLERAFGGADAVFHLAALIALSRQESRRCTQINVEGAKNVAQACLAAGVKRLVHFSSIHALSPYPVTEPVDENRAPADHAATPPYDRSKAAGEREVQQAVKEGLDAVILNPTGVVGPFDFRPSRMGEVFIDLYRGRLPGLVQGGFNWVDVRDVADGALRACQHGRRGERYILAGHWRSIPEVAHLVERLTGKRAPRIIAPMWMARASAPVSTLVASVARRRPRFTLDSLHALRHHRDVRSDKAQRELGFVARPFARTVEDTYAWFRQARLL
jgi:dihydroflavonol-4-reductase